MKKLFILVTLFWQTGLFAQADEICFVTSIKGKATLDASKSLKVGDALSFTAAKKKIRLLGDRDFVTCFSPKLGSFRVYRNRILKTKTSHGNLIHFAKELLRVHERKVSLSSRGNCDCVLPAECLASDPLINDRLLLVDTISFPVLEIMNADSSFYFLQTKVNGQLRSNRLKTRDGFVFITRNDLPAINVQSSSYGDEQYSVGLCRVVNGMKKFSEVTKIKLEPVDALTLLEHYASLRNAMQGEEQFKIFETFVSDVYIYYGKPNICYLKELVNYQN